MLYSKLERFFFFTAKAKTKRKDYVKQTYKNKKDRWLCLYEYSLCCLAYFFLSIIFHFLAIAITISAIILTKNDKTPVIEIQLKGLKVYFLM